MPFTLSEVNLERLSGPDDPEWVALQQCNKEAYENPLQPLPVLFVPLFSPIEGSDPVKRQALWDDWVKRGFQETKADPTSYWQKVTNEKGEIVAGALWKIHSTNPFENKGKPFVASWYPEGGARELAGLIIKQMGEVRAELGQRPQLCVYLPLIKDLV